MQRSVAAVVVTFNRKDLLLTCLSALFRQSHPINALYLIDNAGTDGTRTAVDQLLAQWPATLPPITYVQMKANEGGAGGFYWGVRKAYEDGHDWLWVMDDDAEPTEHALQALMKHGDKDRLGFLCSCVRASDGKTSMNTPLVKKPTIEDQNADWDQYLDQGLVRVSAATFVSVLLARDAVAAVGLPLRRFFIWGDDLEYTARITRSGFDAFVVGASITLHHRSLAKPLSLAEEPEPRRIQFFRYMYRNMTWTAIHRGGPRERAVMLISILFAARQIVTSALDRRLKRLGALFGGVWGALHENLQNEDWNFADAAEAFVLAPEQSLSPAAGRIPVSAGARGNGV